MDFTIATAEALNIKDHEITDFLTRVYVDDGFVTFQEAENLFGASVVRERGRIFAARNAEDNVLAGMVILVFADSSACRLAKHNEVEMHLLAVHPGYRRKGLARSLVESVINAARKDGYQKMLLWTQLTMSAAQHLYESMGFTHLDDITRNSREFRVYEKVL